MRRGNLQAMKFYRQYTYVNLLFSSGAALLNNPFISAIAFINSCAVCVSFHSVLLFDIHAFDKIRLPYTRCQWQVVNFVAHILPVILTGCLQFSPSLGLCASACSLSMHLAWAKIVHDGFVMNSEYIYMPDSQWMKIWTFAAGTHVLTGFCLFMNGQARSWP